MPLENPTQLLAQPECPPMILLAGEFVHNLLPCPCRQALCVLGSGRAAELDVVLGRLVEGLGPGHGRRICDQQRLAQLFVVLMKNEAQLRQDLPDARFVLCSQSLRAQDCDLFFESHLEVCRARP